MTYRFGIDAPHPDWDGLRISITAGDADGTVLAACFDARRRALDDKALALAFLSHPLLTLKVVCAIHWEALRLWMKGVRLHPRPPAPPEAMTIIKRKNP